VKKQRIFPFIEPVQIKNKREQINQLKPKFCSKFTKKEKINNFLEEKLALFSIE